jgi:hypothetical protein
MSTGPFTVGQVASVTIAYVDAQGQPTIPPATGPTAVQVSLTDSAVAMLSSIDPTGVSATLSMLAAGSDSFLIVRVDGTQLTLSGDVTFTVQAAAPPGPAVSAVVTIHPPQ